ncbi:MAG TPA: shikimate dehydrogenase [Euzebyales bacterium]
MTTAATGLLCLLGDPVAHSLSPQLHTAALAACGIDAVYVACRVRDVPAAVDGLDALGALGANVTVPHKRAVWEHVNRRTAEAELIGAANTLFRDGGAWMADNTDAEGVRRVLADDMGVGSDHSVVVFGAGGAARAIAVALGRLRARVRIEARRPEQADIVAALAQTVGARALPGGAAPDVVVNATPLGLHGERLPERYHDLADGQAALDLVYGPSPTPFVSDARARGLPAWDGLGMLVGQAAAAFERWTGRVAPVDVMRAAATAAAR